MKKLSIILIAIIAITFSSCTKEEVTAKKLEGTWDLYSQTYKAGGLYPNDTTIISTTSNEITFLDIKNNKGIIQSPNQSQEYTFEVTSETTKDLTIDDLVTYKMEITVTNSDFTMVGGSSTTLSHYKKVN